MLHVLCRIGRDVYAISSEAVERILPYAALKHLPGAEHGLCGLLNFQGRSVPVVDLCRLLAGAPAREVLSTRILLCPLEGSPSGMLGLLVEGVSKAVQLEEKDFQPAGAEAAACLDGVVPSADGLIQKIEVPQILPPGLLASLGLAVEYSA